MQTANIIEGLQILYGYVGSDEYCIGAEHDIIYFFSTEKPVKEIDLLRLVIMGWFQEDADIGDRDFEVGDYDPEESWACYV